MNDNHQIDRLIRQHLDSQAGEVDVKRFVDRVNRSCARTRRIGRRVMLLAAAAALIIAVCYSAFDTGNQPEHQPQLQDIAADGPAVDDIITLLEARGSQLVAAADMKFRHAEKEIREAAQRGRQLADAIPDAIPAPDPDSFARIEADIHKFTEDIVRLIGQAIAGVEQTI